MLIALVALACRLPSDGSGNESDADTDSDTDADSDVDTDTDADWDAYTGPPRLVITTSDAVKGVSGWAFYDLETLLWRISGEAVDAREVVPTCGTAWVGLVRRSGGDDDGLDLKDAESGFTLEDVVFPAGALPRSACGLENGAVAIGFDTGQAIEVYWGSDLAGSIDLSEYADAKDAVHVAALMLGDESLVAVLDAGAQTNAKVLVVDFDGNALSTYELTTAGISDEIRVVDNWLYVFGRGDSLHPDLLEAWNLSTGLSSILTATGFGDALTAASFAREGLWLVADDGDGTSSVHWVDYDPVMAFDYDGRQLRFDSDVRIGDIAAEGATGFWLTEGANGHTVRRYDAYGEALGSWTYSAPASIRTCGADAL